MHRELISELKESAQEYPVVTVLGPRQAGKTTLCKLTWPKRRYLSLEDPDTRLLAEQDPRGFLRINPPPVIFDEIQRIPTLLSYIQGIVDQSHEPGLYILTGSHQLELQDSINQSLAGRTAVLTLYPFSIREIQSANPVRTAYEMIYGGFYPRLIDKKLNPTRFYRNYLQTYIERDVRAMINLKDLNAFQIFLRLLAGRVGQLINYTSLSNDVGVSAQTIKHWISILKASYVILELPPYLANIRKRLTKAPKLYFTDVGLASYLLDLPNARAVELSSSRGNLFENLVIMDLWKNRTNVGEIPQFSFYRDSHGNEVDLIIRKGNILEAIDIKSAETFSTDFLKGINHFQSLGLKEEIIPQLIYGGEKSIQYKGISILSLMDAV